MYVRCGNGGGSGIDLSKAPDAIYTNANMSNNATASLAVTQKPKFITVSISGLGTAGNFGFGIINVDTSTAYWYAYYSSAFHNEVWTIWTDFITSVTSSTVSIKNAWGSAVRMDVGAYY